MGLGCPDNSKPVAYQCALDLLSELFYVALVQLHALDLARRRPGLQHRPPARKVYGMSHQHNCLNESCQGTWECSRDDCENDGLCFDCRGAEITRLQALCGEGAAVLKRFRVYEEIRPVWERMDVEGRRG